MRIDRALRLTGAAIIHDLHEVYRSALRSPAATLLPGGRADRLRISPPDIRAADASVSQEFYAGRFALAGSIITVSGDEQPFELTQANIEWRRAMHSFAWLRHLRAAATDVGAAKARSLVDQWLSTNTRKDEAAWETAVTARRVLSWLSHAPMFLEGADSTFYARFMRSLNMQVTYLSRMRRGTAHDLPRLQASIACAAATLCMPANPGAIAQQSARLDSEIERQIFRDGGHVSRDPSAIPEILLDILPLRQTYLATAVDPPVRMMNAIERLMPMIRFFRHRDGSLAHFNGNGATRAGELATLLAYDDTRGEPLLSAPHSGYQRLVGLGATILMDTGKPPAPRISQRAHGGCLSFEFSTNAGVIVTNCGASRNTASRWSAVCRSTAAHSTVTLNDASSVSFAARPWLTRRFGAIITGGPRAIGTERRDDEEAHEIAASHDGYAQRYGIIHDRRIVLSADGSRVDGEDSFIAEADARGRKDDVFAIRFHLHPRVRPVPTRGGASMLLRLGQRDAWEFFCEGADMSLEESVYVNGPEAPRRTHQIVVAGHCRKQGSVVWSFIRLREPDQANSTGNSDESDAADDNTLFQPR